MKTRFKDGIAFKRGPYTLNRWTPFCPVCHLVMYFPPSSPSKTVGCPDVHCKWTSTLTPENVWRLQLDLEAEDPWYRDSDSRHRAILWIVTIGFAILLTAAITSKFH